MLTFATEMDPQMDPQTEANLAKYAKSSMPPIPKVRQIPKLTQNRFWRSFWPHFGFQNRPKIDFGRHFGSQNRPKIDFGGHFGFILVPKTDPKSIQNQNMTF